MKYWKILACVDTRTASSRLRNLFMPPQSPFASAFFFSCAQLWETRLERSSELLHSLRGNNKLLLPPQSPFASAFHLLRIANQAVNEVARLCMSLRLRV